jgi:multiple antibiotic resistance protein
MLHDDLRQLLYGLLLVVGGLLPIVNPLGSAPLFLAMTRGANARTREVLATKIAINAFVLIVGSLVFGAFVLRIFGISIPVVQVAGGLVLCALGWQMLDQEAPPPTEAPAAGADAVILKAFYPLTLPLTVDPGAIAVAITIGANHAHGVDRILIGLVAGIVGTAVIALSVWLAYRYAQPVAQRLGHSRMMVVLRLSAFIVLCIGVEITWNGVKALVAELPAASQAAKPAAPASNAR